MRRPRALPMIQTATSLVLALVLSACAAAAPNGAPAASGGDSLTVYVGGDVNIRALYQDTLIPGFEKANPGSTVKLVFSEHGANDTATLAALGASQKTNNSPAMDLLESGVTPSAAQGGLLEKVTPQSVPNLAQVDPQLLTPVNGSATPYRGSSVVLAYDSSKVSTPPTTIDELLSWVNANPGKFTYNSPNTGGSGQAFVQTVLSKNMDPAAAQTLTKTYDKSLESQWKPGLDVLKGLKPSIYQSVYPNGNQEVLNLLGKGQIYMAPVWSDMALSAMKSGLFGPQIKLTQLSNPPFTGGATYLGLPKNSTHKAAAFKFLNYLLEASTQDLIVQKISGYPVVNPKTLSPAVQAQFGGVDTSKMRPGFESKTTSDLNQAWQQNVA